MTTKLRMDRRSTTFRTAIHSIYRNRRVATRRSTDRVTDVYFDRHEPRTVYLSLGILLLCITDAFFTLYLMKNGGKEISPLMDYLIQQGELTFFIIKYLATAAAVLVVLMHKNFTVFKYFLGYHGLYLMLASYVILIIYEISIVTIINFPATLPLF